jgi:hypothetical protein
MARVFQQNRDLLDGHQFAKTINKGSEALT